MPEAWARLRPDPSSPDGAAEARALGVVAAGLRRLGATPPRAAIRAAALTAALVGIVVEGPALQHARHEDRAWRAPRSRGGSAPPTAAQTAAGVFSDAHGAAGTAGGGDAIAQVLRAEDEQVPQKRLAAAQAALVKLGSVVENGEESAQTRCVWRCAG